MINPGTLHLFPCPISEDNLGTIPADVINAMKKIDFFIAERAKTARRFLKQINHPIPLQDIEIFELDKKGVLKDKELWLEKLMTGEEIGLLSEAGTPCIADPGEAIVGFAHQLGVRIKPYVGPNSIILALMSSGLNGEQFSFHTYLPIQDGPLNSKLKYISNDIQRNGTSHIFIETPYRNIKLLKTILKTVPHHIHLCIASDLTGAHEFITTKTIKSWKKEDVQYLHKTPAVFILGKIAEN